MKVPYHNFESTIAEVRLANCHRGLKWVGMVESYNLKLNQVDTVLSYNFRYDLLKHYKTRFTRQPKILKLRM